MRKLLKTLEHQVNAAVDWFIPSDLESSGDQVQAIRMFLFSHLFGPFLGLTISFSMLYIKGGVDTSWWVFFLAVVAFWPFPIVLRYTSWYVPLALLSIENLMFCIFWGCYNYGGVSSPIMPWLITVPLLGFFYLRGSGERVVVGCMIVANLAAFYVVYTLVGFPNTVPMDGLVALGLVSTLCASIYVSMMALYYGNIVSSQAELEQEVQRHLATEEMLREATKQAERATLAKSDFLAKMSHELRNPLNSIIGYSEMLIEEVTAPDTQKTKDLTSIRDAGYTLLELINDLLDLSKFEAGKMEAYVEPVDLASLMNDAAEAAAAAVAVHGNKFIVEPPGSTIFMSDAAKLRRTIDSLLSNAAKYTMKGTVTLAAAVEDDHITISVNDTGIGIAPDHIGSLFETFQRSETETASNYGDDARLGLPLAYRYCQLLGGDLLVESTAGKGSRFSIRLPNRAPSEPEVLRPEAHSEAA